MENPSSLGSLDPEAVNLAKAIRQTESGGNFQARGKSGEYGAYQFTAPTWDGASKKYGINVPLEQSTPEQQNEVAYRQIKEWKDKGNNPGQIASMWNAGEAHKDAYQDESYTGVNKFGAKYNVPAYAKSVATAYQQIKAGGQPGLDPNNPSSVQVSSQAAPVPEENAFVRKSREILPSWETLDKAGLAVGGTALAALGVPALLGLFGIGGTEAAVGAGAAATGAKIASGGLGSKLVTGAKNLLTSGVKAAALKEGADIASGVFGGKKEPEDFSTMLSGVNEGHRNSSILADSLTQAMSATPTGRVAMQNPETQNAIQTAAMYGYAPELGEKNSMDFAKSYKKSFEDVENLHKGVANALDAEGVQAQIQEAISHAKQNARQFAPSSEWEDVDRHIEQLAGSYEKNFGKNGSMSLGNFLRMKSELGRNQKFGLLDTSANKNARKALAMGARATIEGHTKHQDLFNRTMKEEQSIIKAREIMKRLNGKKALENTSTARTIAHRLSRDFSIYFGSKIGGPLGAIVGGMTGEYLAGKIDKAAGKSIFDTPAMRGAVNHLQKESPEIYKFLLSKLAEVGEKPTEGNLVSLLKQGTDEEKGIDAGALINLPKHYAKKRDERLKKELAKGSSLLKGRRTLAPQI